MVNPLSSGVPTSAPNINIPEKQKNEAWYTEMVRFLVSQNISKGWSTRRTAVDACYEFYDSVQNSDEMNFVTQAVDGSSLPAPFFTIPKIRNKINLLVGEFMQRGYDFKVDAINEGAKSRKLEAKSQMLTDMKLQRYAQEFESQTGLPFSQENLPEDQEELDEYFDKNYKETSELIMYWSLKYLDKMCVWGKIRQQLFLDMLVSGMCFVKTEICNGLPRPRRVDPRNMVYDTNSENDLIHTDSTYFAEVRWMPIGDAAEKYNLTVKELKECNTSYQEYLKSRSNYQSNRNQFDHIGFDSLRADSGVEWFSQGSNGLRVLVFEAYWQDYKTLKYKESENKYGGFEYNRISDAAQDREGVTSRRVKVWRKGTLIGGQFLKDWGMMENQARDGGKLSEVDPPYFGLIPYFVSGRAVSMVDQLKSLQNLRDIVQYQITLGMSRMGGKGFVYDVSQCPPDWGVDEVMKYLKTTNIAFIDSKANGTPSQYNQFQTIDLSADFTHLINLMVSIDRDMDMVSGVNEARQGILKGASQGASVTQSALLASSTITEPYFKFFNYFASGVWSNIGRLTKIAWEGKERFAPIIGDAGVDFLKEDIDLSLDDYGIFIEETPRMVDDINSFQQIVMMALQTQAIPFDVAMRLLMEKDVVAAVRKLEKEMKKLEKIKFEQERQLMKEQEELKLQGQQKMNEWNETQANIAAQRATQVQSQKDAGAMERQELISRTTLSQEQLSQIADIIKSKEKSDGKTTKA
jgi:hypothetical protein